jgi:hypothetical protein
VRLEKGVLLRCARLDLIPLAPQDVLTGLDQLTGTRDTPLIDDV